MIYDHGAFCLLQALLSTCTHLSDKQATITVDCISLDTLSLICTQVFTVNLNNAQIVFVALCKWFVPFSSVPNLVVPSCPETSLGSHT